MQDDSRRPDTKLTSKNRRRDLLRLFMESKNKEQYDILKTELLLCQQQMDKYDHMLMQIKTWSVTLWAAAVGWAFQIDRGEILFIAVLIVAVFWAFDALHKSFRYDYKTRRNDVAEALAEIFRNDTIPSEFTAPKMPAHRTKDIPKSLIAPHVCLLYLTLIAASTIIFRFGF